jgi:hypothetical protein
MGTRLTQERERDSIGTQMTRMWRIYADFEIRWRSFWLASLVFLQRVEGVKEFKGVFMPSANVPFSFYSRRQCTVTRVKAV